MSDKNQIANNNNSQYGSNSSNKCNGIPYKKHGSPLTNEESNIY